MEAQAKLTEEIDLLKIIKQLRVAKFVSESYLTPWQILMVQFFSEYKLALKEEAH